MNRLARYLNPITRLGENDYSFFFPLFANIALCILSEIFAYGVAKNPMIVGVYIIFLNVGFIIYFAFRDGIRAGFISTFAAVIYYFYIIYTRHYKGDQLTSAIDTTVLLGVIYSLLAYTIGWLKERIDKLIEREADEKRRLETIIAQLPVGVIITDKTGKLIQRNKQTDTILGVKLPIGFMFGKDTLKVERIDDHPINPSKSPLVEALTTGNAVIGREMIFQRKDGKKVFLQVSSAPIHNRNKAIIAAASIINDITKLKELERQKDEFLGIVSHELKTPVTSIKAYAQVLESMFRRKGDLTSAEHLSKMDSQVNKLNTLISDLLDVTKIQAGRLQFNETIFDFNPLVIETVEELQRTSQNHTIITELAPTASVRADRERIGQVITNFITNAIKYSPHANKIIVTTMVKHDTITLGVQDFGIGIPKDKQQKVFQQFYRVGGDKQHTFSGLGLGLYICSQIIKREKGKIWVQSTKGKGSTFYFSLPTKVKKSHE